MKHTLLTLLVGLLGAIGAHQGWVASHHAAPVRDLESQLAWMQRDLHLSPAQMDQIRALHRHSRPRLLALGQEVARLRQEASRFEEARQTAGQVDFVKFARFAAEQRALDQECLESARQLIASTAEVMTSAQRDQYLALLTPVIQGAAGQWN